MRLLIIIILLLGINNLITSQNYNYKHYTVEDGLPSSEVYSTFQDSKGYIWFATDAGVSRFNGYEFKTFNVKDGLTDNTVFLIREDSKGRIWFGTFNKKLCYFFNDSIYSYTSNNKILESIQGNAILSTFAIDVDDVLWMGYNTREVLKCSISGVVETIVQQDDINSLQFFNIKNEVVWSFLRKKSVNSNNTISIDFFMKNIRVGEVIASDNPFSLVFIDMLFLKRNTFLFFFLEQAYLLTQHQSRINSVQLNTGDLFYKNRLLSCSYYDDIWLCIENEGVYRTSIQNNKLIKKEQLLENKKVSRVFKDKEGGFWFTTIDDGVYYLNSLVFKSIKEKVFSIEMDSVNNALYIATTDKKVIKKSLNRSDVIDEEIFQCNEIPQVLQYDYNSRSLLFDGNRGMLFINDEKNNITTITSLLHSQTKAITIDNGIIYRVNGFGISKIVSDKEVFNSFAETEKKYWCTSLIKDKNNVWVGTNQGLILFDDVTHKISEPFKNHKLLGTGITCLEKFNNDIILVGTKSFGLVLMQNKKIITILNKEKGLVSNMVKSLHVDYQNDIWIGTNKGLSRLKYVSSTNFSVQNINTKHGLISNEISQIKSYKNSIFLVTPKHLVEFDKTKIFHHNIPSPLYLSSFKVNDKEIGVKGNSLIELKHYENRVGFNFESLNYKSQGDVEYNYRLIPADTTWQSTSQNTISFYGLPPNSYTFEVKAKNEDGYWSSPINYSFKINAPYWLTWWFIGVEILFGLFIILIIFKYRDNQLLLKNKNLQKISENEKKIIELELKALKSQINPHFIFNTLNSIQHFISSNNFKDSNRYITNFSKLIRMVLNHSEKSYISLRDEMEMLNLYLTLEQVRFSNEFDFVVKVDESVDLDFDKIPPMLIQPFVENAIWHGLMNKKEKGFVEVKFVLKDDYLFCTVNDNGIGRAAAEEIKSKRNIQNKSVGMTITKERLNIINSEMYESMNVEMVDLFDSAMQPEGTKVIIKIKLI